MPKVYIKKHPHATNLGRPTNFDRNLKILQHQARVFATDEDSHIPDIADYFSGSSLVSEKSKEEARAEQQQQHASTASFDEIMLAIRHSDGDFLSGIGQCQSKKRKRSSISRAALEGGLPRAAMCKIYKEVIDKDIRHIYPGLVFNAFNAGNFDHLRALIERQVHRDIIATRSQMIRSADGRGIILGGATELIWRTKGKFFEFFEGLVSLMPDAMFVSQSFELLELMHVPRSFSGTPFHLFQDKNALNEFLFEDAEQQRVRLEPGTVVVGHYSFSGTPTAAAAKSLSGIHISAASLCSISFDCTYIFTLGSQGEMMRLESFVHLDESKLAEPDTFHHPLSNFTFDCDN